MRIPNLNTFTWFFAATLIAGCGGCAEQAPPDMTGWVPQAALDSSRADNIRLTNELAYFVFRLEECQGPQGSLSKAQHHASRGEHGLSKPHIEAAKAHGGEHARKAETIEASAKSTSTEKVTVDKLEDHIVTEVDEAHGTVWYYDRRVPRGLDTTTLYLYIGHKETGAPWLRMRSQYAGDHWLYIKSIKLTAGNIHFERHPDPVLIFSRSGDLVVSEWEDTPPSDEDLRAIRQIIGSPDAELSFVGHRGTYTRKITDQEREGFISILALYQAMGKVGEDRLM